jgi:hypothetical protein
MTSLRSMTRFANDLAADAASMTRCADEVARDLHSIFLSLQRRSRAVIPSFRHPHERQS